MNIFLNKITAIVLILIMVSCSGQNQGNTTKDRRDFPELRIEIESVLPPQSFRGICLTETHYLFISGREGSIYFSRDTGKTWLSRGIVDNEGIDIRDIDAFNDSILVAMTAGFPCKIYRSTDQGISWKEVYHHPDSSAFLDGIDINNKGQGVAFGDVIDGYLLVLTSADYGESWKRIDSTLLPTPLSIEAGFAASGSSIALSNSGKIIIGLGGDKARVLTYLPQDTNWYAINTPMAKGKPGRGIYSIALKDELHGLAVGGAWNEKLSEHTSIYTRDGGKTWQLCGGKEAYRSSVSYLGGGYFISCGPSGIDITQNSGLNWKEIDTIPFQALVADTSVRTAYAVGKNGLFCKISCQ